MKSHTMNCHMTQHMIGIDYHLASFGKESRNPRRQDKINFSCNYFVCVCGVYMMYVLCAFKEFNQFIKVIIPHFEYFFK